VYVQERGYPCIARKDVSTRLGNNLHDSTRLILRAGIVFIVQNRAATIVVHCLKYGINCVIHSFLSSLAEELGARL
jgi:hypothetical protein